MSDAKPSATLLRQRIRNRLFEVMRAAATFEGVASVGAFETINGWDDFSQPERFYQPPVFSPDECLAIEAFGRALDHASDATETDVCSAAALSARPEWRDVVEAAMTGIEIFDRRGSFSDIEAIDANPTD